jgi:hypothetical protein
VLFLQNFWLYPLCSLLALLVFAAFAPLYIVEPSEGPPYASAGATLLSIVVSVVCLLAFAYCPYRRWAQKITVSLLLLVALGFGVAAVGSFIIHLLRHETA